ncbi:hypothetical protein R1sor_003821 [Riccia sorocarpa]|uniref:FAS1 domain-containing protein n=1 Tax=Riccia sorocarpa TaxID=122646 RepID=A0ABD3H5J7_9MARC
MATGGILITALIWLSITATTSYAQTPAPINITSTLAKYPEYKVFSDLLVSTGVDKEVNTHTSITLLVPSNDALNSFVAATPSADVVKLGDIARFHFLLTYYGLADLQALPTDNYTIVTTLYQTTGKANGNEGSVEIYNTPGKVLVGPVGGGPNASVVESVLEEAYKISIIHIDSVLEPSGFNVGDTNLINVLESFQTFGLFISLLQDTGVDAILAGRQTSGLTVLAPTDSAFATLNGSLATLSPARKKVLAQYHALTSYYALADLQTLVETPVQTLASTVAGGFKLNVTSTATTVTLTTGVNNATLLKPLYDAKPAAMYSVDKVLLPTEYFGTPDELAPAEAPAPATAPPPSSIKSPPPVPQKTAPAAGPVSIISDNPNAANVASISGTLSALLVLVSSTIAFFRSDSGTHSR